MKKLVLGLVGLGVWACQQNTPPATGAFGATSPIADTLKVAAKPLEQPLPILFTKADTLTAPMRKLLKSYNLAKLWQGNIEERKTNPTLTGFFGPDHYRFCTRIHRSNPRRATP